MSGDEETPVVERKQLIESIVRAQNTQSTESDPVDSLLAPMSVDSLLAPMMSNLNIPPAPSPITQSPSMLVPSIRKVAQDEADMSQSYHEIFDTQGYLTQSQHTTPPHTVDTPGSVDTPGTETGSGSVDSGHTETGHPLPHASTHSTVVYYNEGEGRLVSCSPPAATPMSQYLTSKLVADSLMWQQTFRNDSPSPEEPQPTTRVPNDPDSAARPRPSSLGSDLPSSLPSPRDLVVDPMVLNDIEKEARRLATDVDSLVENLSCVLQSVSALTVETVQTYRDGVCKTCDEVDSNIRGMYQLMAKWEELNKNMAPAYRVSSQIKDIKRLLDMFEAALV
eukprot:GFUD01079807.1.p1 GENE.GFUD01079807.1~~GFUD01079807.1.p1  ORF type:complete len:336 (-),score=109.42 GFUD01079807.1:356-1363(-)